MEHSYKLLIIDLIIFPFNIYVYLGNCSTQEGVDKLNIQLPKTGCKHGELNTNWKGSCFRKFKNDIGIIFYKVSNSPFINLKTIRHEVQHACNMVWEDIKETNYDSEALLYLNDYVFKEIVNHFIKNNLLPNLEII